MEQSEALKGARCPSPESGRRIARPASGTYLFLQERVQFPLAVVHTCAVGRVDDPDDRVRLFEIVAPVRPERSLPANVPCRFPVKSV